LNDDGEPVYGPRDTVDLARMRALGLPFWLAGSYASPARLREARSEGAAGVQVGTAFALCEESGLDPVLRERALAALRGGEIGRAEDTRGRKCICNGLVATVGLGQGRASGPEPPIVTAGDDLRGLARLLESGSPYSAADVVSHVLGRPVG